MRFTITTTTTAKIETISTQLWTGEGRGEICIMRLFSTVFHSRAPKTSICYDSGFCSPRKTFCNSNERWVGVRRRRRTFHIFEESMLLRLLLSFNTFLPLPKSFRGRARFFLSQFWEKTFSDVHLLKWSAWLRCYASRMIYCLKIHLPSCCVAAADAWKLSSSWKSLNFWKLSYDTDSIASWTL